MANLGGPFEEFIAAATASWQAGVDEYRDGDESVPFVGDPLALGQLKSCTLYAYSKQAEADKLIDSVTADQLNCLAFDAYKLLERAKVARVAKAKEAKKRADRDEAAKNSGLVVEEG